MRHFYFFFFFVSFNYLTGFALLKKEAIGTKGMFIAGKKVSEVKIYLEQEHERLAKDFSTISLLKTTSTSFLLFIVSSFFLSATKIANIRVVIKKLKFKCRCLFKMLYPKHVFW